MIPCQRSLFEIPDDVAYLNCAYMAPLMRPVSEAGCKGVRAKSTPWGIQPEDFFLESEATRALFAELIGARADDIAIVPSVSYGMATAAKNLPCQGKQKVIVLEEQFPSNVYPWQRFAEEHGASVRMLRCDEARLPDGQGHDWTQAVLDALDSSVAVVALPHCHWVDGSRLDLVAISAAVKKVGAALVLDVTQSCGALPIDMRAVQPDFLVCSAYKWLLGPYSLGFMYVAPRWQNGKPLEEGWITRKGARDFARLVDYQSAYQAGARRFDMGERSNFHLMPMAHAALTQILAWGVDAIAATLAGKTQSISAQLEEQLGLSAPTESIRAGHYLGVTLGEVPEGLLATLRHAGVFVSMRGDAMRITPHLYNHEGDTSRFLHALKVALRV